MSNREHSIENYLDEEIKTHFKGGITRKWVSPGHMGVPDRICFVDPEWYVEVKTTDGTQTPWQEREAQRLIAAGARVAIVYGHHGVDEFITWLMLNKNITPRVQVVFK